MSLRPSSTDFFSRLNVLLLLRTTNWRGELCKRSVPDVREFLPASSLFNAQFNAHMKIQFIPVQTKRVLTCSIICHVWAKAMFMTQVLWVCCVPRVWLLNLDYISPQCRVIEHFFPNTLNVLNKTTNGFLVRCVFGMNKYLFEDLIGLDGYVNVVFSSTFSKKP